MVLIYNIIILNMINVNYLMNYYYNIILLFSNSDAEKPTNESQSQTNMDSLQTDSSNDDRHEKGQFVIHHAEWGVLGTYI